MKDKFVQNASNLNKKLDGFQRLYQQHASGLMTMNSSGLIPPGHPLRSPGRTGHNLRLKLNSLAGWQPTAQALRKWM